MFECRSLLKCCCCCSKMEICCCALWYISCMRTSAEMSEGSGFFSTPQGAWGQRGQWPHKAVVSMLLYASN